MIIALGHLLVSEIRIANPYHAPLPCTGDEPLKKDASALAIQRVVARAADQAFAETAPDVAAQGSARAKDKDTPGLIAPSAFRAVLFNQLYAS